MNRVARIIATAATIATRLKVEVEFRSGLGNFVFIGVRLGSIFPHPTAKKLDLQDGMQDAFRI